MEKYLILELGQEMYKINWKHLVLLESKKGVEKKTNKSILMGGTLKGHCSQ